MKKSALYNIHSLVGLVCGFFILLMSLSGAALVFHEDINTMQQPEFNVWGINNLSPYTAYNNLRQRFPNAQISSCRIPADKETPFVFSVYEPSYNKGLKPV